MEFCKKALFCLILTASLLLSCKNASDTQNTAQNSTLKKITDNKNSEIQWTQELEKGRLSQKINRNDYIINSIKITPEVLIALDAGKNYTGVYPEIKGFASLDIRDIDTDALYLIDSFFVSFINGRDCDKYMEKDSLYSLALFSFDLEELNIKPSSCRYLVGKAIVADNSLAIPVRLYNNTDFVDTNVYLKEIQFSQGKDKKEDLSKKSAYEIIDLEIVNHKYLSNREE